MERLTRSLRTDGQDTYTIAPNAAPDHATRRMLAQRAEQITGWIRPAMADQAVPFIAGMLGSFPARQEDAEDVSARIGAYCVAVAPLPLWAVSEACAMGLRGSIGNSHGRFAPTPGELYQAGERLVEGVALEKQRISRILRAKIVAPPNISPERRKEIAEEARRLVGAATKAATNPAQPLPDYAAMPVSISEALADNISEHRRQRETELDEYARETLR